nr:hypothetical protein [Tanacetum cinerariifolium]
MVVKMISSLHSYQPCVADHLGSVSRNLTVHFMFKLGIPTGTNPKSQSCCWSIFNFIDDRAHLRRIEALNSPKSPETSGTRVDF